jgi:poly(A) polymerase
MLGWLQRWRKKNPTETTDAAAPASGAADPPPEAPVRGPDPATTTVARASAAANDGPRIISRAEHKLSRRNISVDALKVMGRLIQHGYKGYLVGGGVRDVLLGRKPKDFDVATDAHPEQVRALFRNSRMIGRRFRLVHVFFHGGEIVEVSTFRRGIPFDPDGDSVTPNENTFGTPEEDARRRDLTINGLFYDLKTFAIYDYVGGIDDLKNGVVRVIGEPGARFREDPIRMLRAVRHSVGVGFDIEPVTLAGIRECAGEIAKANASRRRDEFLRELTSGRSRPSLEKMLDLGLLEAILPPARDVLGANGPPPARAHFLANLGAVDEAIQRGRAVPLEVIFAAFCAPFVAAQDFAAPDGDPRQARGFLSAAVRDYLKPLLAELGVSRAHAEATAIALVGARQLTQAAARGSSLPKNLTRRATFPTCLLVCQIEARGRREWLPKPLYESARERDLLLFGPSGPARAEVGRRPRRRRGGKRPADRPPQAAPAAADPAAKPAPPSPAATGKVDPTLRFDPTTIPKPES